MKRIQNIILKKNTNFSTFSSGDEGKKLFSTSEVLKFHINLLKIKIQRPYLQISFENWKPKGKIFDLTKGFYTGLSRLIGNKTPKQIKSFEQRLKNKERKKESQRDLLQICLQYLEKRRYIPEVSDILERYSIVAEMESKHMRLVNLNLEQMEKHRNELEKLYSMIMKPTPTPEKS